MPPLEPITKRERTHQRILHSAARVLRRAGFGGVGVAQIMRDAGLTHGGFYAHFASREALLADALDHAAGQSLAVFEAQAGGGIAALIDAYLSDAHAAHPEQGCTLAALGTETPRQSPELRSVATRRLKQMLRLIEQHVDGTPGERRDRALAALATLVGSLVLSRLVSDERLGRAFRSAAKRFLRTAIPARQA